MKNEVTECKEEQYEKPTYEVILLDNQDVITSSIEEGDWNLPIRPRSADEGAWTE